MIWPTVLRGFSDEYGSWKIICISRRSGRSWRCESFEMSRPSKRIVPPVGSRSRRISRAVVDLPQPDSPDDAEGLAAANVQGDVLDGVHLGLPASEDALLHREALGQVLELDEVVGGPVLRGHAASPRRAIERFAPSRSLSSQDR